MTDGDVDRNDPILVVFIPAKDATVSIPDSDFLTYGFWLKKTEEDGVTDIQ